MGVARAIPPGLPAGGTTGQQLAKVDSADYNAHWVTPAAGGGTPGGATGQVQVNAAGAFAGYSGLAYDAAGTQLKVGGGAGAGVAALLVTGDDVAGYNTGLRLVDATHGMTVLLNASGYAGANPYIGTNSYHPFYFVTDNAYRLGVSPSGSILVGPTYTLLAGPGPGSLCVETGLGVRTSAPSYPLHVVGDTDPSAVGPVLVQGTISGTIGTAVTLDATASGGRSLSVLSGSTASGGGNLGAGNFGFYCGSLGHYFAALNSLSGSLALGVGWFDYSAQLSAGVSGAGTKGILVRAAAGQTANLIELQDNAGTPLFWADSAGVLHGGGLGTAATHAAGDFQAAGSYAVTTNNLSDLASAAAARTNLGLGTAATHPATDFAASVSLTTPGVIFGTPVTFTNTAGAFAGTLALNTQAAHAVFIGPASGSAAAPTFRALAAADVPDLSATYTTRANNLSDVASAATARTNLGVAPMARTFGVSAGGLPTLNALTNAVFLDRAFTCSGATAACDAAGSPSGGSATLTLQTSADGVTYSTLVAVSVAAGAYSGTAACTTALSANTFVRGQFTAVNGVTGMSATLFLKG